MRAPMKTFPMKSLRMSFVLIALALAPTAWAQQSSPLSANVEQQMSAEQFKAAGLDKLSPQELAALNAWLQHKVVQETAKVTEAAKEEGRKEVVEKNRGFFDFGSKEAIESSIVGNFDGFSPQIGRMASSFGVALRGDGAGHFTRVPAAESGLLVPGQGRDIARIRGASGDAYLVARNNDAPLLFRPSVPPRRVVARAAR